MAMHGGGQNVVGSSNSLASLSRFTLGGNAPSKETRAPRATRSRPPKVPMEVQLPPMAPQEVKTTQEPQPPMAPMLRQRKQWSKPGRRAGVRHRECGDKQGGLARRWP